MIVPTLPSIILASPAIGLPDAAGLHSGFLAAASHAQPSFSATTDLLRSQHAGDLGMGTNADLDMNLSTAISTIALVTASDMIPFVPCQPLAVSLGAAYGPTAFPVCVIGQTLAGVLAFSSSRKLSDPERIRGLLDSLGDEGNQNFKEFRALLPDNKNNKRDASDAESLEIDDRSTPYSSGYDERTIFLALVGLRLAPFFPFSAGNYLLGGATNVGLRPFILATFLGCFVSNLASVGVGMGGAELWFQQQHQELPSFMRNVANLF
ncbi:unnamed protein product [Pseudo-nitzschia multistriata]|uniref:VTT domain-containing protein n=1 Tax=Pseudo-nitzschia multistriata TaxID=183589 RepID=A0A448Z309_9STRA|nr:unnamed protein product [Pseudo-nitzschia multistriata]